MLFIGDNEKGNRHRVGGEPIKLIDSTQVVNQNVCLAAEKASKSASERPFNLYRA